ncbi:MAG: hypothetical protein PQJ59_17685 [Spirochaetales bacterium]|nr:hypothetical protein [Spirochaetales bacterium]
MGWPKYLKKTYSKEELNKKVLKKVQLTHDKEFLAGLFVSEKRGEWHLKADLSKEETKHLKKLVKEIKKGKGGVKMLPLIVISVIVGASVVFALFFKNPLADRLIESSLEDLFEASADAEGVNVSLLKMELSWDSLAVADSSDLESNLFELGETKIKLNSTALLEKKFVMENLVSQNAAWGTYRDYPGEALSPSGEAVPGAGDSPSGKEDGSGLFAADNFRTEQTDMIASAASDPKAFVDEQWDSLATPAMAEDLRNKYDKELADREASLGDIRHQSEEVISEGRDFLGQDFSQYKSNPAKIPELVEKGQDFYEKTDDAAGDVSREIKAIDNLRTSIKEDRAALMAAKDEDMARMKSLVAIPEGGVKEIVNGMVQSYLYSLLGDKYVKAQKIAAFIKKYKQEGEKDEAKESAGRSGRVVSFDTVVWPEFLLQEGLVSAFGEGFSWEASLADIAGDPDQWDEPSSGHVDWNIGSGLFEGDVVVERRRESVDPSTGDFSFAGLLFETDTLSGLGISRARGDAGGTADLTVARDGSWEMASHILVTDPELVKSGDDLVADVVYSVLAGDDWDMTVTASGGEDFSFTLEWPLLSQVDDEIGALLKEQAEEYLEGIEEEMIDRYAGEIGFLDDYLGDLDDWESVLTGDLSSLDSIEDQVDDKIDEVKEEAVGQAEEKVDDALEDLGVKDQVDDAAKKLNSFF